MEERTLNNDKSPVTTRFIPLIIVVILTVVLVWALFYLLVRKPAVEIIGGDSVIKQIKSLNRYETATFTVEKIIEAGTTGNQFRELLFGDRILLIAHGEVVAGVDLSKMDEGAIDEADRRITVNLPPTEIFTTSLDNTKTRVYDRRQGYLTQGNKDLESTARLEAEKSISMAACEGGVLVTASNNAKNQLTVLLKSMGFTDVTVNSPVGGCDTVSN